MNGTTPPRVLLVDDSRPMLAALQRLLTPGFDLVGEARDGTEAVELARSLAPDVIVLDVMMPRQSGIEAARQILASGSKVAVVMLTVIDDPVIVAAALQTGALGYILKARAGTDLEPAIRAALAGQTMLSPGLGTALAATRGPG